jgi:hypothetical protein
VSNSNVTTHFQIAVPFSGKANSTIVFPLACSNTFLRNANPGVTATLHQRFKFERVGVSYAHFCGYDSSGDICIMHSNDPTDVAPSPANFQNTAMQAQGVMGAVNANHSYTVPKDRLFAGQNRTFRNERSTTAPYNEDNCQGVIFIGCSADSSTVNPGTLIISGDIRHIGSCQAEPWIVPDGGAGSSVKGAETAPQIFQFPANGVENISHTSATTGEILPGYHTGTLGALATALGLPASPYVQLTDAANRRFTVVGTEHSYNFGVPPTNQARNWTLGDLYDYVAAITLVDQAIAVYPSKVIEVQYALPTYPGGAESTLANFAAGGVDTYARSDVPASAKAADFLISSLNETFGCVGPYFFALSDGGGNALGTFATSARMTSEDLSFLEAWAGSQLVIQRCLSVDNITLGTKAPAQIQPRPPPYLVLKAPTLRDPVRKVDVVGPVDSNGRIATSDGYLGASFIPDSAAIRSQDVNITDSYDTVSRQIRTQVDTLDAVVDPGLGVLKTIEANLTQLNIDGRIPTVIQNIDPVGVAITGGPGLHEGNPLIVKDPGIL